MEETKLFSRTRVLLLNFCTKTTLMRLLLRVSSYFRRWFSQRVWHICACRVYAKCTFASSLACRFAVGFGFAAAVLYELLIPILFYIKEYKPSVEKFYVVFDLPIAAGFFSCGTFLAADFGVSVEEKSAKIAVCAVAFLGFILLVC